MFVTVEIKWGTKYTYPVAELFSSLKVAAAAMKTTNFVF